MGQDALTNSLFIEQGQIDSLITDSPANRKENFNEIIQLNGFEKAIRELDPLIKELGLEVKRKDTLLNESGETKEKISTAKNELKSLFSLQLVYCNRPLLSCSFLDFPLQLQFPSFWK